MSGAVEKCPILHVRPKFDVFTLIGKLSQTLKFARTMWETQSTIEVSTIIVSGKLSQQ